MINEKGMIAINDILNSNKHDSHYYANMVMHLMYNPEEILLKLLIVNKFLDTTDDVSYDNLFRFIEDELNDINTFDKTDRLKFDSWSEYDESIIERLSLHLFRYFINDTDIDITDVSIEELNEIVSHQNLSDYNYIQKSCIEAISIKFTSNKLIMDLLTTIENLDCGVSITIKDNHMTINGESESVHFEEIFSYDNYELMMVGFILMVAADTYLLNMYRNIIRDGSLQSIPDIVKFIDYYRPTTINNKREDDK